MSAGDGLRLSRVGVIGFGEAGSILAADLAAQGLAVAVYDRLLGTPSCWAEMVLKANECKMRLCENAADAVRDAQLVISAVTAGNALAVARRIAPVLQPEQVYLDINSVAPATKQTAFEAVQASGASYIDAAVMAPVPPQRLAVPMLLGGHNAAAISATLNRLGGNTRVVADQVGVASAIKMCRSVMIKGLEALTTECLLTARQYGADAEVLASLHKSFPSMGWDTGLADYLISRVAEHGRRRAEEMLEVAQTVRAAGREPTMSEAIAHTQLALVEAMHQQGLPYPELEPFSWQQLDALLKQHR